MFFYAIYNSKLWKKRHIKGRYNNTNKELKSRFVKVLLIGSILYIIIRSLLYSDYMKDMSVKKYSKYFYGIVLLDALLFLNRYNRNIALEKKNYRILRNKLRNDKLAQQMLLSQMQYPQEIQQKSEIIDKVPVNISLENEIPTNKIKSDNKEKQTSDNFIVDGSNDSLDIPIYTSKKTNNSS